MNPAQVDVLLVSGLHANEVCAPVLAARVHQCLLSRGVRVAWFDIPRSMTLLGLLDDPDHANTRYSHPEGGRRLDMDLEGLADVLRKRHPGALIFEFHNAPDSHRLLQVDPAKPVQDYELGTVAPHFVRPYEIGTWRNIDPQGRPAQFVIELPARYRPVAAERLAQRRAQWQLLEAGGAEFDAKWRPYLEAEADLAASRQRGYLDDSLVVKVGDWICRARGASP